MACRLNSSVVNKAEHMSGPGELGKRGSELEAMEEEGEVGKPVRKKRLKRVLRAKKRGVGHRLNTSRLHGHCINSSLNSTLLKQTLRTNNRALAKALEMKRQDLNVAQQIIVQLQEEQQRTQQQLSNLQHVAGLKDSAIETEVQLRIQSRMDDTKKVLSKVCMQLLSTVELIHGALDISSCRSSSVSRPSTPAADIMSSTHKSVFYNGPCTSSEPSPLGAPDVDIVAASTALDRSLGDVELAVSAVTGHPDLSVILEQSQLMDAMPIPFTEDDQGEGRPFVPTFRTHSRHRKESDRRARPVYPPACTIFTPPLCQPCSDMSVTDECQSRHNSTVVPVSKSQREMTKQPSTTSEFESMSLEDAFGRRDAGRYRAEDRPLPTLAKKQKVDVSGDGGGTSQGHVNDLHGCHVTETSKACVKKCSKLKRASRVMVSSLSHQEACGVGSVMAAGEKVVKDGVSHDRRGTFVMTPTGITKKETQGSGDKGVEEEDREVEEKEEGILEEELGNILVTDFEDDILTASPIIEANSKCVGHIAQEHTIYSDEDMEMTGVLNVPLELDDGKMAVPAYINKESAHEPSFLANVTAVDKDILASVVEKQSASNEPEAIATRKAAAKKPRRKTDKPPKHKLTLKKGNGKTSRRSSSKKLTKKVDPVASDDETKASSDTETKKFSTYITKPGQMSFTTGKLDQMAPLKGTSMLPRVTARSKPRAKTNKNADIPEKDSTSTTDEPKSVFDLSMNESVIMVRTKYSDFREHYNASSGKSSSSDDASSNVNVEEHPHGIMLTLGNGKRTKPRRARSKQVSYASHAVDVVALVSDVTKADGPSPSTGQSPQHTDCDDLDSISTSGEDNVFVSDTLAEGGSKKESLSCKGRETSVRSVDPDEETHAVIMESDDIVTDDMASDMGDIHEHGSKGSKRKSEGDQQLNREVSSLEKCVEDRDSCDRPMTEEGRETLVNKAVLMRESKVTQKEGVSKVKENQVKSKVKEYESKMKENKLRVKQKDMKSKAKQKGNESDLKEKCSELKAKQKDNESNKDKSKVKQKATESQMKQTEPESKVKQKEVAGKVKEKGAESKMQQKESTKRTETQVRQKQVGQRPKDKETPSKNDDGLSTEKHIKTQLEKCLQQKRRSGRSIVIVNDASYKQSDKENDASGVTSVRVSVNQASNQSDTKITAESCKKQKLKKQSVHTRKLSATNRKRSADDGGETVLGQIAASRNPAVGSKQRPSIISRVSISLPDVSPCKRRRRAASSVNYKEPSLHQKLRQGDPHTASVYVGKDGEMVVPPISAAIKTKSDLRLSRRPLDTITNSGSTSFVNQTSDIKCV